MKIINPSFTFEDEFDGGAILRKIERAGRVCYKSEERTGEGTAEAFAAAAIARGHESILEHASLTVRVICDRGVTHELVRHRIASFSQESTRYCNYSKGKFGSELTVIKPCFWDEADPRYALWKEACESAERSYFALLGAGASAQEARDVLPNSLKTEIVVTMNMREWRHFFALRASGFAHPQMREIAGMMLKEFRARIPVLFDNVGEI